MICRRSFVASRMSYRNRSLFGKLVFAIAFLILFASPAHERAVGGQQSVPSQLVAETISVGKLKVSRNALPDVFAIRADLGLLTAKAVTGKVIYGMSLAESQESYLATQGQQHRPPRVLETRCVVTPKGDLLLMFPYGQHYAGAKQQVNDMLAFRSLDNGTTWDGPQKLFKTQTNQHGFVPLVPRGSHRIYAFGTQPEKGHFDGHENAAIGYRWSNDDGRTWTPVTLISPSNDSGYQGMSVMRMAETGSGAWVIGSHTSTKFFAAEGGQKTTSTRQFVLRSDDQGRSWEVFPGSRPHGWKEESLDRMEEGRIISLGAEELLLHLRTATGRIWEARSSDGGKTWSKPKPTALVHPLAPPMTFHLSDGKTLAAFHHNLVAKAPYYPHNHNARREMWISTSTDGGRTWSEPRFVFANATSADEPGLNQCSYLDLVAKDDVLHMFIPHQWRRALHLQMKEADIANLPTASRIRSSAQDAAAEDRRDEPAGDMYRLRRTDIVPHRGGRAAYPESTMYAYVRNLKHGVSMDADIRRTGDGDIVVIHDETTGRTCDKDYVVAEKTVAELKTLDAAYHFDPRRDKTFPLRGGGIRIPTLDEAMQRFASEKRPGAILWIDTKDDEDYLFSENQGLYDRLIELIGKHDLWEAAHVEVSAIREAEALRQRDPRVRVVYYTAREEEAKKALSYPHYARIGVPPGTARNVARQIRAAGKQIQVSKVTRSNWDEVRAIEPDSIGSDRYLELLEYADPAGNDVTP